MTVPLTHRGPLLLVYALFQQTDRLLEEHQVNARMAGGSYAVYSVIAAEEPVTPTRLAQILGMPPTSLSYQIRQMHERGHLRRVPNPQDGRSVLLKLTPKGRRIVQQAQVGFASAIESFRAELQVEEPELLMHLEAMSAALENAIGADQKNRAATR